MTEIENYTLSCPCKGRVIDGSLVRVHGEEATPHVGALIACSCGCVHIVREVDDAARLVIVAQMSADEIIAAQDALGEMLVKVVCPHCEAAFATTDRGGSGTFEDGYVFACSRCNLPFVTDGERDGVELRTRALTDAEREQVSRALDEIERSLAERIRSTFGPGDQPRSPFGDGPFSPFGKGGS